MKWLIAFVTIIIVGGLLWWIAPRAEAPTGSPEYVSDDGVREIATSTDSEPATMNPPRTEVIAVNLFIPWEVLFLPDGELLVTERAGTVLLLKEGVEIPIEGVRHVGEGGLLGAVLHPEFSENQYVYLYQTTETSAGLRNRVDRYTLRDSTLTFDRTVVDNLPGARYHDGGRIAFGPDGYLYVTLGDTGDADASQDTDNLAGSILRYTAEGDVPEDNPFPNAIYSYGHRNPQGLTWDDAGNLWSSEHGRSGVSSGYDEINLIMSGANYGWPVYEGDSLGIGVDGPVRHSGADTTWAPGDIAYHEGSLYMPGLRGRTLYEAVLEGTEIVAWYEHFVGEYGRLRTVEVGPDGLLYLTTSNRDGRTTEVAENDDRIIRINPTLLERD